ncbi:cysteine dioxygenase [Pseudoroseomonas globiformis]|uniref:Cysteine dioxygenase n=1 Tax=Teichococcus globiformis TaxID=2307229 RepID=A0ABV7G7D3_9PROT
MLMIRSPFQALVDAATLAWHAGAEGRAARVAEGLVPFLRHPKLLEGFDCSCQPQRYVRHRLHSDPAGRFAIAALVWRPGQMSPIHAHHTWCALGIHRGTMTETFYTSRIKGGAGPEILGAELRRPGDCSHGDAGPDSIHRLANLGCDTAVTIHVYGVAYDRFASDVNLVYAA